MYYKSHLPCYALVLFLGPWECSTRKEEWRIRNATEVVMQVMVASAIAK